jgi:hypothetical protein
MTMTGTGILSSLTASETVTSSLPDSKMKTASQTGIPAPTNAIADGQPQPDGDAYRQRHADMLGHGVDDVDGVYRRHADPNIRVGDEVEHESRLPPARAWERK